MGGQGENCFAFPSVISFKYENEIACACACVCVCVRNLTVG